MEKIKPGVLTWQRMLEVILLFLKLGTISFGGPVAHISLMEQEVVMKRGWLSREHFLDLLAATNLVPGPNATEMAIHIGYVRAGWGGLFAGGIAFIIPAFLISLALSLVYTEYGALPQVSALFYGIYPAVMAILLSAGYRLARSALLSLGLVLLSGSCLAAVLLGVNEVVVLLVAGVITVVFYAPPAWLNLKACLFYPLLSSSIIGVYSSQTSWVEGQLVQLVLFFLKVGALLFGTGMVLFAFIERDVVSGYGWLNQQQLLDAIAVGQMTPGPVLSAVTFIGFLVAGLPGAAAATVAVFLPSFVIVAVIGPWLPRLRRSLPAQAFLKGVNAAVVALILAAGLVLFRSAIMDAWTLVIFLASLAVLILFKVDSFWLIVGGAALGLLLHL